MGNWSDCICGRLAKKFGLSRTSTSDVSCPFDYPPSLFVGHKSRDEVASECWKTGAGVSFMATKASDAARAITHFLTFAE